MDNYFSENCTTNHAPRRIWISLLGLIWDPELLLRYSHTVILENVFFSKVLVYRLGGSSCEVSIVNVASGVYQTLGSKHSTNVAGYLFTEELVKYFVTEFKRFGHFRCSQVHLSLSDINILVLRWK